MLRQSSRYAAPIRIRRDVQAVGLAVLIRSARPVAQYLVAKKLEVHFPRPGRSRETRPVRLVHHRDDPTSTANRLVSDDLLHFEVLKRSRTIVVSDVVQGGFLREIVEDELRLPRWQNTLACRHGREDWHRACSVVPKRASEHPPRTCRRVDRHMGAQLPGGSRPECQRGCRGQLRGCCRDPSS